MEATTEEPGQLRKALEWELSLDSRDLRSHAWYHGAIPRLRAEQIVARDGDFLVRDCASQPGDYVLTCRTNTQCLHFVINKVVIRPDTVYERVQYQFEDDAYDTVPDLITYYVGSGKPISVMSGAKIWNPRNRMYPLSFYASKYSMQMQMQGGGGGGGGGGSGRSSQSVSPLASPLAGTLRSMPTQHSPAHSPPRSKRDVPPRLPSKKQRSQSLTPSEANGRTPLPNIHRNSVDDRSNSADGVISSEPLAEPLTCTTFVLNGSKFSTNSLPRGSGISSTKSSGTICPGGATMPRGSKIVRVTSDPALSPCLERRRFGVNDSPSGQQSGETQENDSNERPPPKPSRLPGLIRSTSRESSRSTSAEDNRPDSQQGDNTPYPAGTFQRVVSYHASGSDSGNGSGDSVQSSAAGDGSESTTMPPRIAGVVIKNPRFYHQSSPQGIPASCSSSTLKAFDYDSAIEDVSLSTEIPEIETHTMFDLENFQTLLLPTLENKPLDATALKGVKMMLQETGSRILANHLTRIDLELTIGSADSSAKFWNGNPGLRITSGVEILSLPLGHQFRLDLIERVRCLKLLVAVTILTCNTESERAEALNKWIQVAIDTKTALGNLFGFSSIMLGLCMPQIQRLTSTWHILRQKFTDSAFNFEAKLRPTLKSMNESTNPQAPNTTIPHILPYILLQERSLEDILSTDTSSKSSLELSCLTPWETTAADAGLSTLLLHVEAARKFSSSIAMLRRNAQIVLGDSKVDDLLLDMFRTEFQLKFLWGSRGAAVASTERHHKFEQVLTVMSLKCEQATAPAQPSPASQPYNAAIGTSV
ncbi:SH2 domain-containing protein 3C [Nilaparvata lugens]|uniref:SH2 domain-containing protein 3C n=1 Tax=Nilaparvata lugens TaxID=108931 RepID=UPI000B98E64E|nr:SH2 domain-containing protein 3C [Nilaparvata lugens]